MPFFSFKAQDAAGRSEGGRIEALSGSDAYRKLRERGLQPSKVVEEGVATSSAKRSFFGSSSSSAVMAKAGEVPSAESLPKLTTPQLLFFTEELAELLKVTRRTINSIEREKYNPSIEVAFRIARLFNVPVEEIFSLDDEG